jgi:hypothetical protein
MTSWVRIIMIRVPLTLSDSEVYPIIDLSELLASIKSILRFNTDRSINHGSEIFFVRA